MVLAGGTESMSQAPYAVRNARWGTALGVDLKVKQSLAYIHVFAVYDTIIIICVQYVVNHYDV